MNHLKLAFSLKAVLFEILFVCFMLVIYFLIANSIGIIHLQFPLPNKNAPNRTYFSYSIDTANKITNQMLHTYLPAQFLPTKINTSQNILSSKETTQLTNQFSQTWTTENVNFISTVFYTEHTNDPKIFKISASTSSPDSTVEILSSAQTMQLLAKYLQIPTKQKLVCKAMYNNHFSYCEATQQDITFGVNKAYNILEGNVTFSTYLCKKYQNSLLNDNLTQPCYSL